MLFFNFQISAFCNENVYCAWMFDKKYSYFVTLLIIKYYHNNNTLIYLLILLIKHE